jgi:uncharacterized protein YbjT (DUF2867 family)
MDSKIIAVTGATGQQGGAVARKLLADGWMVRALTRDLQKPAARSLAALGAEIVAGDLDRPQDLDQAFKGAHGVFSVQNYWIPSVGFEGEIRQGRAAADAAMAAGVAHRGMGQKHFDSKWIIEQHIQSLGNAYTILRPVAFYENFNWQRVNILNGTFEGMGLRPEKERQLIAVEDIAAFAAIAFADPKKFAGRTIELAGDALTDMQIADTFAKVIGRPVKLVTGSGRRRGSDEEMKAMFNFFNGQGYDADIPALRRLHPALLTLEQYLRKNGWENAKPIQLPERPNPA